MKEPGLDGRHRDKDGEIHKKRGWEKLEELIIEGLDSGPPIRADKAFWEEKMRRLHERYPELDQP